MRRAGSWHLTEDRQVGVVGIAQELRSGRRRHVAEQSIMGKIGARQNDGKKR